MPRPRSSRWRGSGAARRSMLLRDVGATVGADVPFFLSGGTALGLGRGEEIYPLVDLPPHFVVIVRPPFGVSTAEAYAWYDEDRASGLRENARVAAAAGPVAEPRGPDDQRPRAAGDAPAPGDQGAEGQLRELGAIASAMSGSGSAVFGLSASRRAAERAVKPLSRNGAKALVTRTLTRAEHERRGRPVARQTVVPYTLNLLDGLSGPAGAWPSGKARDFGSRIRRFESSRPNHASSGVCVITTGALPATHGERAAQRSFPGARTGR